MQITFKHARPRAASCYQVLSCEVSKTRGWKRFLRAPAAASDRNLKVLLAAAAREVPEPRGRLLELPFSSSTPLLPPSGAAKTLRGGNRLEVAGHGAAGVHGQPGCARHGGCAHTIRVCTAWRVCTDNQGVHGGEGLHGHPQLGPPQWGAQLGCAGTIGVRVAQWVCRALRVCTGNQGGAQTIRGVRGTAGVLGGSGPRQQHPGGVRKVMRKARGTLRGSLPSSPSQCRGALIPQLEVKPGKAKRALGCSTNGETRGPRLPRGPKALLPPAPHQRDGPGASPIQGMCPSAPGGIHPAGDAAGSGRIRQAGQHLGSPSCIRHRSSP